MAGQTDTPDKPINPEQSTAQSLVQGDSLNAYRTPGQPLPNADKPGAPTPAAGPQDGGAAAPPGDAAALAGTPPANDKAAAPAPAPGSDTALSAAPRSPADAGDNTRQDVTTPAPNALDLMNKVNAILDGDIPKLNKAHDLAGAEKAYDSAVALANQLTPADIAKAHQELVEVRKEEAKATDPATQRDLANKEVQLYTITRLKDAALGNEALWYYRQGRTEQGNEKLLEACGVDSATADKIKKLDAPGINAFAQILQSEPNAPTILGDTNFYRQINKINEGGGQVPALFGKLHEEIVKQSTKTAAGSDTAAGAGAGHDSTVGAGHDGTAGKPAAPYDATKSAAAMGKFIDLAVPLVDKPGPLSADQRATLEAGVKAFDDQNAFVGSAMDGLHKLLAKTDMTADQKTNLAKASDNIDAELKKAADANNHKLPDAVSAQVDAFANAANPAAAQAAIAALDKSAPGVGKAIQAAVSDMPADADGLKGVQLAYASHRVEQMFCDTSAKQFEAHALYAKILTQTKNPPDAADMAHAKEVFLAGMHGIPQEIAKAELQRPDQFKLAQTLGILDASGSQAAGADKGAGKGTAAAPGSDNGTAAGTDAGTAPKTGLAAITNQDLMRELDAAQKKGPAGFDQAKALYEEAIRRVENPADNKAVTDLMKTNLTALETGKLPDGTAITPQQRTLLHEQNIQVIDQLSASAQLHSQFAAYLGANKQSKSQDIEQRQAIAAADAIDPSLLLREDAQLNKDRANNAGDLATLNQIKVLLEGGKDASGVVQPSLMNLRVSMRDDLAVLYLKEGLQVTKDGHVVTRNVTGANTDSGFKPQYAQQLLTEARAAYQTLNGKGAKDAQTEQIYALGQSIQPEVFKSEGQALKNSGASVVSDVGAFFGSQAGRFLIASGIAGLDAATEGKIKINPMMAYGIGTAGAIGSGILTRHFAQKLLTGQDESWTTSAVHGTAAALAPEAFRAGAKYVPMGWEKAFGGALSRSSEITSAGVLENVGRSIGPDATPSEIASVFERGGLPKEAEAIRALGTKATVTPEDIAALNLDGARGTEALAKLNPVKAATAREVAIADHLGSDGMNVKTVGDLSKVLERENGELADLQNQVKVLSDANKVGESTPIRTALKKLTDASGKPYFSTSEELDQGTSILKGYGINNVGDLAKREPFTMKEAFPQLAGAPPETSLAEAARKGIVFGDSKSIGRNLVENVELPEAKLPAVPAAEKHGFLQLLKGPRDAFLKPLVAHDVDLGVDVSRTTAASDGTIAGRVSSTIKSLVPKVGFHAPSIDMPDAYWTKLTAGSTDAQFNVAANQLKYWRAAAGTGAGFGLYNTTTDVYDKYLQHEQYRDASGNLKDYTLGDAVAIAAKTTALQAVTNAMLFEGAVAPTFESGAAASSGWVSRSLASLRGIKMPLMTIGVNGVVQGYPNWSAGNDKLNVYNNTQKPLQDVPLYQNVGTTADVLAARQAAQQPADNTAPPVPASPVPAADNAPAPAPAPAAGDNTVATPPAIVDPMADSIPTPEQINQDQPAPKPAAKPAAASAQPAAPTAPAPAHASGTSAAAPPGGKDLGADAPPGQI